VEMHREGARDGWVGAQHGEAVGFCRAPLVVCEAVVLAARTKLDSPRELV
jgi:hypothetical protein